MGNLNAEQIKKALECCSIRLAKCVECPYQGKGCCTNEHRKDALALIKLQEQRIEELTEDNERLMRGKTALECVVSTARNQAKADTVRKMQERLKDCFDNEIEHKSIYTESQVLFVIDQIANEILNGEGMCNEK